MYDSIATSRRKCLFCDDPILKGDPIVVYVGRGSVHKRCDEGVEAKLFGDQ